MSVHAYVTSSPGRNAAIALGVPVPRWQAIGRNLLEAVEACVIYSDRGQLEHGPSRLRVLGPRLTGRGMAVSVALDLSEQALQRLIAWSPAIPKEIVNWHGTRQPSSRRPRQGGRAPPRDRGVRCARRGPQAGPGRRARSGSGGQTTRAFSRAYAVTASVGNPRGRVHGSFSNSHSPSQGGHLSYYFLRNYDELADGLRLSGPRRRKWPGRSLPGRTQNLQRQTSGS